MACGILVLWPGIKTVTSIVGSQSLNHWTTRETSGLHPVVNALGTFIKRSAQPEGHEKARLDLGRPGVPRRECYFQPYHSLRGHSSLPLSVVFLNSWLTFSQAIWRLQLELYRGGHALSNRGSFMTSTGVSQTSPHCGAFFLPCSFVPPPIHGSKWQAPIGALTAQPQKTQEGLTDLPGLDHRGGGVPRPAFQQFHRGCSLSWIHRGQLFVQVWVLLDQGSHLGGLAPRGPWAMSGTWLSWPGWATGIKVWGASEVGPHLTVPRTPLRGWPTLSVHLRTLFLSHKVVNKWRSLP